MNTLKSKTKNKVHSIRLTTKESAHIKRYYGSLANLVRTAIDDGYAHKRIKK